MKPVFIDFHIHTSENPGHINASYDVNALKNKIESISDGADYLISLTDHNVINKSAYLNAVTVFGHILLGVELHVRNYDKAVPYHCHILFNIGKIDESVIDELNAKLDYLYPRKIIENNDANIPKLEARQGNGQLLENYLSTSNETGRRGIQETFGQRCMPDSHK